MTTIGTVELIASINTADYKKGEADIKNANKNIEDDTEKTATNTSKSWSGVAKVGLAAVATAAVAVGAAIVSNFDNAIKRVDTLNNSTRTFENLGFGAEQIDVAMKGLEDSIKGLPTSLDEAVRGVQLLSGATGDISKSQQIYSSLNNAIIGFGGSSQEVTSTVQQLTEAFSNGRVDAGTWTSLIENGLGPALNGLAKSMGLTTGQLKEGLAEGTISVEQFQDSLIKMNKEGGGSLASFEQIAKDATSGIGTGWQNLQTAITRGIASMIQSIGSENISIAITNLGKGFEAILKAISGSISFLIQYKDTLMQLGTVISILLVPAMLRFVATMVLAGITSLATGAQMAAAWLLALGPIGLIIAAVAAAVALIIMNWDTVKGFVLNVWESIQNGIAAAFNWVKSNWPLLLAILTGPIGLAVIAITKNFDKIREVAQNVWGWITGIFGTIGEIGTSMIKGAVNSVLGFAENTINGFIRLINAALGSINKIPGVNISEIGQLSIPKLAKGGIVSSPTLAMIGEGREAEAVIPLSKLDKMLSGEGGNGATINQTNNIYNEIDLEKGLRDLSWRLQN